MRREVRFNCYDRLGGLHVSIQELEIHVTRPQVWIGCGRDGRIDA